MFHRLHNGTLLSSCRSSPERYTKGYETRSKLRAQNSENQKPHSLTCELIHSLHILSLIAFPILCISCTLFIYVCMFVSVCVLVYSFKDNWLPPQRQTNRAMDLDTVGEACSCPSLSIDHHTHTHICQAFLHAGFVC